MPDRLASQAMMHTVRQTDGLCTIACDTRGSVIAIHWRHNSNKRNRHNIFSFTNPK